jgi:selenocysteine-specific elongation factor
VNYLTLAIIGHIDHGKTALVKALTGVETDRLKEERERGITIVLGYAHLDVPSGEIGIIDAPGHERFVRTMVSGATGSEAALLVVDVNEGVKPQTIEHLNIATLLGIKHGIVAITKCDTADDKTRESAAESARDLVAGTFLANAPIVYTSAITGEGIGDVKAALNSMVGQSTPLRDEGATYLPVDRAFSMTGFGTVVTGTLRRGAIRSGDEVVLHPRGVCASVRALQSHSESTDISMPGHRTAVNLRGISKSQIKRGDVIATPGTLMTTRFLDAEFRVLADAENPVKHGQGVRLLFGTKDVAASVHLLDRDQVAPGESCYAQFKTDESVAPLSLEPYIVRASFPAVTIGGGRLLASSEGKHRRRDPVALRRLEAFAGEDVAAIVEAKLLTPGTQAIDINEIALDRRLKESDVRDHAVTLGAVVIDDAYLIHRETYDGLGDAVIDATDRFHQQEPTAPGLSRHTIEDLLPARVAPVLLAHLLDSLTRDGRLVAEQGVVRLPSFNPAQALSGPESDLAADIEGAFLEGGLTPPGIDEIIGREKERRKIYRYLLNHRVLVEVPIMTRNRTVNTAIAFHQSAIDGAKETLLEAFCADTAFTAAEAKSRLATSRKFIIPLLEHLDATGFTKRTGDTRVIVS